MLRSPQHGDLCATKLTPARRLDGSSAGKDLLHLPLHTHLTNLLAIGIAVVSRMPGHGSKISLAEQSYKLRQASAKACYLPLALLQLCRLACMLRDEPNKPSTVAEAGRPLYPPPTCSPTV